MATEQMKDLLTAISSAKVDDQRGSITEDDILKKLAWEVAKNVIDHHKNVYPKIFENAPSTFPISIRNSIYNQIASAMKCENDLEIYDWIKASEQHRKEMRRLKRVGDRANTEGGDE